MRVVFCSGSTILVQDNTFSQFLICVSAPYGLRNYDFSLYFSREVERHETKYTEGGGGGGGASWKHETIVIGHVRTLSVYTWNSE